MHARRLLVGVVAGGLILFVGGCRSDAGAKGAESGKKPTSSTVSSSPSSPSPSSASTGPSSATPSASGGSSSPSAVPTCGTRDLRVSLSQGEGAAGSVYYQLVLRNISSAACRTGGYGGVSMVGTAGRQIGAPADRVQRNKVAPIVLAPGHRAHATLQVVQAENYPAARCDLAQAAGLRVYPPNQTASRFVRVSLQACRLTRTHLMTLAPYQPQR